MRSLFSILGGEHDLEFVVENQDEGSTHTSEDIGEGSLEEGLATFILVDLGEAVEGTVVKDFLSTRLHHESSSDGIEGIREQAREGGDELGNDEFVEDAGVLVITEQDSLQGIVTTEVASSVGDDTEDGDTETLVETLVTISFVDLGEAINKTSELSFSIGLTDISSKSSSGKIQGVDEHQRSSTSSTTGGEVTNEELPEFSLGVVGAENLLVGILESEVQGLSGEVSDDVSEVTSPESADTFFLGDSGQTINDTSVLLGKLSVGILSLEKKLNSFNGSDSGLGDGSRDTTQSEIEHKIAGFNF